MADFCGEIVWSGDSNSRRVLKSLHVVNETRWCQTSYWHRNCQCEDNDHWPYEGIAMPGINFTVVRGLVEADGQAAIHFAETISTDTRLLILGHLVNWDTAFSTFAEYRRRLDGFLSALKDRLRQFSVHPLIILRTGMYYCCTHPPGEVMTRLYTRKRILMFNEYAVSKFHEAFPPPLHQVLVWDAFAMGSARPIAATVRQIQRCPANHFDSLTVAADLTTLLNMICNAHGGQR